MSEKFADRILILSLAVTVLATSAMYFTGHWRWAFGFLTGAGLSIFSLATISLAVSRRVPPKARNLLKLALWLKLPAFAGGLYFIVKLSEGKRTDALLISIAGIGLVPALVALNSVRDVLKEIPRERVGN